MSHTKPHTGRRPGKEKHMKKLDWYLGQVESIGENLTGIRETIAVELEDGESRKEVAALRIREKVEELLGLLTSIALYGEDE
jgi:hypothetical protein